ncbi:MAG: hypothetical protein A3J28_12795 [Acidobacteria bacterium RIFCSPLOWO2_12_FULL_60_22]|nr:MAG: hypothetical protein A3J28_12795 [Acidobacteria bacterium RIFCSPLOWO2_12_FULL_60_22]
MIPVELPSRPWLETRIGTEQAEVLEAACPRPGQRGDLQTRQLGVVEGINVLFDLLRDITELQKRSVEMPCKKPLVEYNKCLYQAASWKKARRLVAHVEHHSCKLLPRVGSVVTKGKCKSSEVSSVGYSGLKRLAGIPKESRLNGCFNSTLW